MSRSTKVFPCAILAALSSCTTSDPRSIDPPLEPEVPQVTEDVLAKTCAARRGEALNPNQHSFQRDHLRWSCADSPEIHGANRGQEYCEYFAVVRIPGRPGEDPPAILGNVFALKKPRQQSGKKDKKPHLRKKTYSMTRVDVSLSDSERQHLEENPTEKVGECVFTSWNEDQSKPLPCTRGTPSCPRVMGIDLGRELFRMRFEVNSLEAAQILVEDCFVGGLPPEATMPAPPPMPPPMTPMGAAPPAMPKFEQLEVRDDPDPFLRGCYLNAGFNETQYRKSDTVLCTVAMRVAECGCDSRGDLSLMELLSPPARRGFPLGTWRNPKELPAGCRVLEDGEGSRTAVACTLSAADVLRGANDVKQICREKYGPDIVVYVPVPRSEIECDPKNVHPSYAAGCTNEPWIVAPLP